MTLRTKGRKKNAQAAKRSRCYDFATKYHYEGEDQIIIFFCFIRNINQQSAALPYLSFTTKALTIVVAFMEHRVGKKGRKRKRCFDHVYHERWESPGQ